jgi:hypothetical protein
MRQNPLARRFVTLDLLYFLGSRSVSAASARLFFALRAYLIGFSLSVKLTLRFFILLSVRRRVDTLLRMILAMHGVGFPKNMETLPPKPVRGHNGPGRPTY